MTTQTLTATRPSYWASRSRVGTTILWVLQVASAAVLLMSVTHLFIIGGNPLVPVMLLAATGTIAWVKKERT